MTPCLRVGDGVGLEGGVNGNGDSCESRTDLAIASPGGTGDALSLKDIHGRREGTCQRQRQRVWKRSMEYVELQASDGAQADALLSRILSPS